MGWGVGGLVFGGGAINFHPKHLGEHQNSISTLYREEGALKTYFNNRSGLEKYFNK